MAQMFTNIRRIVEEDISSRISMLHVLFEAITNAIRANADQIICRFFSDAVLRSDEADIIPQKITGIDIEDNGDGFDDDNVTDVDEKLEDRLATDGCKPLFSTDKAIYYRYYEKINAFIYVLGVQTLIDDAEARNKIFIDIIKKQKRLKGIFRSLQSENTE